LIRKARRAHRIARRRSLSPEEFGEVVEIGGEGGVCGEVSERPLGVAPAAQA